MEAVTTTGVCTGLGFDAMLTGVEPEPLGTACACTSIWSARRR